MADNLEKKSENNNSGKTARQLEALGYKPLINSAGYMFQKDAKPMLYRLDADKQLYFPSNPTTALKVEEKQLMIP